MAKTAVRITETIPILKFTCFMTTFYDIVLLSKITKKYGFIFDADGHVAEHDGNCQHH